MVCHIQVLGILYTGFIPQTVKRKQLNTFSIPILWHMFIFLLHYTVQKEISGFLVFPYVLNVEDIFQHYGLYWYWYFTDNKGEMRKDCERQDACSPSVCVGFLQVHSPKTSRPELRFNGISKFVYTAHKVLAS